MRFVKRLALVFVVAFLGPLTTHALYWSFVPKAGSWSTADWSSAGLLPAPTAAMPASVQVFAAPVGRWRGIFAVHSWVVIKRDGEARYERYDVVGWGAPLRRDGWAPDARWYGFAPDRLAVIEGDAARAAIARLDRAIADYPFAARGDYRAWPGPNSNTFVATLVAAAPELAVAMPPNAIGKDYRVDLVGFTPSGTGVQASLYGLLGVSVGWVEGLEVNVLGLVAGLDLRRPALKLPGWGRLGLPAA